MRIITHGDHSVTSPSTVNLFTPSNLGSPLEALDVMLCDQLTCQDLLSAGRWSKLLEHGISPGRSRAERGDHTCEREAEVFRDAVSTQGFPGGTLVKKLPANAVDTDSIPWVGKIPWRRA